MALGRRVGQWQRRSERIGRLRALLQREATALGREENQARIRDRQTGTRLQGPFPSRGGINRPTEPYAELFARQRNILGTQPARPNRFNIPDKSFLERVATSKLLTESVLGESTGERVRSIPVVGPALERNVVPLTTVPGLAATALFPSATLYGAGAATAASLAGQAAEELGAPRNIAGTGIGTRSALELGGGLYGGPGGGVKRAAPAVEEAVQAGQRNVPESLAALRANPELGGTRFGGSEFDNVGDLQRVADDLSARGEEQGVRAHLRARKDYAYPERGDYLYLDEIEAHVQGEGAGSRFMEDLIATADANGTRILLHPSTDMGATSVKRLRDFYGRFGFKKNTDDSLGGAFGGDMIRQPRQPRLAGSEQSISNVGGEPPGTGGTAVAEPPKRTYVVDLNDLDPESVGVEGKVGTAIAKTGIDPSAAARDPVAKIAIAFKKQIVNARNLATVAVDSALEPFYGPLGRMPFRIDNNARISNIETPTAWMDVFSNPTAYNLTPDQTAYVDRFLQVVRETEEMRVANGLPPRTTEEAIEDVFYVPRQVLGARGVEFTRASKASLQRQHEFAEGGIEAGARYDRDPLRTLRYHVDAAYDEVAGKQLGDALEPFSQPPSVVKPDATGALARATEGAPGELFGREGQIPIALWRNRFFPKEQADFLKQIIDPSDTQGWVSSVFGKFGNYVRFLSASLDFAAPFIHGLPLLGNDPRRWAQATWRHYNAFFDPSVRAKYMADNLEDFQEMAKHGIPVNEHEFFKAIQEGGGISASRVPGAGAVRAATRQTFGRGQAAFDTFAAVARHQLWVGLKDAIPDAVERATLIRNMTGGQVTSALGVKAGQQGFESTFLAFSPALLRSTASLFVKAAQPNTPAGRQALRSLLTLASGVTATYIAIGKANGKSDAEIRQGLDPTQGKKFLSYKVGEDWVGLGGQVRAMVQLAAGVGSAVAPGGKPIESLISNDVQDNPLTQAYLSRGAVGTNLLGVGVEGISGGNLNTSPYENPNNIQEAAGLVGQSALPFSLQGAIEGQAPTTVAAGFLGMRTSRETRWEALQREWKELYPDTPFNLTAARSDPALANEIQDWEKDRRSKETPGAVKAVQVENSRHNLEIESGLGAQPDGTKGLAGEFLAGNKEVGPAIIEAYDELQDQIAGVFEATYLNSDAIKATTKDEKLIQQLQGMNSRVAPYRNFQTGEIDYDKLESDHAGLVKQLSAPTRKAYEGFTARAVDADLNALEPQIKVARQRRGEFSELPRWDSRVENQDKLAEIHAGIEELRLEAANAVGAKEIPSQRVYAEYARRHPEIDDLTMMQAYKIRPGTALADKLKNPARFEHLRLYRDVLEPFFPELYNVGVLSELYEVAR